jgi:2-methylcitrate dehydratase PrpD
MEITREIARRVAETPFESLSGADVAYSRTLAMSALGAMVAGHACAGGDIVARHVARAGGAPEATVLGAGGRAPVEMAAFANGTFAHATEYEDDSFPEAVSSYTLFPALFALGEKLGASGRDVIVAFALAYEAQARIGLAVREARRRGFMVLSLAGSLGCAAGAARLLGLGPEATADAISIAASQAGGVGYQTGTMAHIAEMGFSARNGLAAALLAADGFTGQRDVLEAPRGLFSMIAGDAVERPEAILADWGAPYRIHEVGIKFYPCCYHLQRMIEATLELRSEEGIGADDIREIEVAVNCFFPTVVQHDEPGDGIEAQFSLPHALAAAMLEPKVLPASFSKARIEDPSFRAFRRKVRPVVDESLGWAPTGWPTTIAYRLVDGREIVRRPEAIRGQPPDLLSFDECVPKYRACVEGMVPETGIARSIGILSRLEDCADIRELIREVAG